MNCSRDSLNNCKGIVHSLRKDSSKNCSVRKYLVNSLSNYLRMSLLISLRSYSRDSLNSFTQLFHELVKESSKDLKKHYICLMSVIGRPP